MSLRKTCTSDLQSMRATVFPGDRFSLGLGYSVAMLIIISSGKTVATTQFPGDRFSCDIGTCTFSWSLKSSFFSFQTITHTVQKTGYTLSDILRIFRVYASRIPLAE